MADVTMATLDGGTTTISEAAVDALEDGPGDRGSSWSARMPVTHSGRCASPVRTGSWCRCAGQGTTSPATPPRMTP